MTKRRKTDEEIKKNRNARMLRYYYNKKEKALTVKINNQRITDSLKKELEELFFKTDMDNIDINNIQTVREIKLNSDYNIQIFKLGNNYIWRYKNMVSDLLPISKVLKDAKKALI